MRHPDRLWQIEVPLRFGQLATVEHLEMLREEVYAAHGELHVVCDDRAPVEIDTWRVHPR